MAEEVTEYVLRGDELNFVRSIAHEYASIQLIRRIMRKIYTESEFNEVINSCIEVSENFNLNLNDKEDPQSLAWKKQISAEFKKIYGSIASSDKSWDEGL